MTSNLINYWNFREKARSNLANEAETYRSNVANEEIRRAQNALTAQYNAEMARHNQIMETYNYYQADLNADTQRYSTDVNSRTNLKSAVLRPAVQALLNGGVAAAATAAVLDTAMPGQALLPTKTGQLALPASGTTSNAGSVFTNALAPLIVNAELFRRQIDVLNPYSGNERRADY